MATAVYKVNYQGLRKRESYNEIVDYLENKQEKINYPNRFAKQIRNSPELSNLLDGEGMGAVEMEEQQMKAMEHEQAEQAVRQAGGTAQVLRAAASQTDKPAIRVGETQTRNPKMESTGSQAWRPNVASGGIQTDAPNIASGGIQTDAPSVVDGGAQTEGPQTQIFDMTLDDNVDAMMDEVQAVSDQQAQQVEQRRDNITRILQSHLGNEVTPGNLDFAHQLAQQSASSSSSAPAPPEAPAPNEALLTKPPSPRLRDPIDKRSKPQNGNPKAKVKTRRGDEFVPLETSPQQEAKPKAKSKARATKKKGTKQETNNPEDPPRLLTGSYQEGGASSSSVPAQQPAQAPETTTQAAKPKKTITKDKPKHDTTKDTNASPKYWARKNVGYLIDQLQQHHGVRFTKEQLKGKNKLKKGELLDMIKEKLGI